MKKRVMGVTLLISLSSLAQSTVVRAEDKAREFYFQANQQRFINQPLDARMLGMAGSSALGSTSALSTAQNPAGLGLMKHGDLSVSYGYNEVTGDGFPFGGKVTDKQNSGQVFGASPINPTQDGLPESGTIGIGWWGGNGELTPDSVDSEGAAYQISGAYGKSIGQGTSIGYGLTYQDDSVDSDTHEYTSSESFLHTLGIQHWVDANFVLGGVLSVGHGDHRLEHLSDGLPPQTVKQMSYGIGVGGGYTHDSTTIGGAVDYTFYTNNGDDDPIVNDIVFGGDSLGRSMNVKLGVEHYLVDWFALRAGYRYAGNFAWDYDRADLSVLTGSARYNAWTMGVGVRWDLGNDSFIQGINLDYAAEYRAVGYDDWQHLVSVSTPFDLCA